MIILEKSNQKEIKKFQNKSLTKEEWKKMELEKVHESLDRNKTIIDFLANEKKKKFMDLLLKAENIKELSLYSNIEKKLDKRLYKNSNLKNKNSIFNIHIYDMIIN